MKCMFFPPSRSLFVSIFTNAHACAMLPYISFFSYMYILSSLVVVLFFFFLLQLQPARVYACNAAYRLRAISNTDGYWIVLFLSFSLCLFSSLLDFRSMSSLPFFSFPFRNLDLFSKQSIVPCFYGYFMIFFSFIQMIFLPQPFYSINAFVLEISKQRSSDRTQFSVCMDFFCFRFQFFVLYHTKKGESVQFEAILFSLSYVWPLVGIRSIWFLLLLLLVQLLFFAFWCFFSSSPFLFRSLFTFTTELKMENMYTLLCCIDHMR